MLRCPKTSVVKTPPRARTVLHVAICDGHWEAVNGVQRFHDTSPKDGACNTRLAAMHAENRLVNALLCAGAPHRGFRPAQLSELGRTEGRFCSGKEFVELRRFDARRRQHRVGLATVVNLMLKQVH